MERVMAKVKYEYDPYDPLAPDAVDIIAGGVVVVGLGVVCVLLVGLVMIWLR